MERAEGDMSPVGPRPLPRVYLCFDATRATRECPCAGFAIVLGLGSALSRILAEWHCVTTHPEGEHAAVAGAIRSLAEDLGELDRRRSPAALLYQAESDEARVNYSMVRYLEFARDPRPAGESAAR